MFKNYRKVLFYTYLSFFTFSCSTQQNVKKNLVAEKKTLSSAKNNVISNANSITSTTEQEKHKVSHIGNYDFFTYNIGNPSKNDNTASFGSIVSAKPSGYQVTKNHFPAVSQNFRQRFVILHYTNLNDEKSIMVLTQRNVSSHYLVNDIDDKEIYQFVDENKRAYHAGVSHWRGFENLNDTSIGIEITNMGYTMVDGEKVFAEYPEYQFKKVAALVKDIVKRYQISPINVLAHSDIAPTRKQDPGPKFPWKRLYTEYQVGMWYDEETKQNIVNEIVPEDFYAQSSAPTFIFRYQSLLKDFGYGIQLTGDLNDTTKKTIEAFQYHFRPEKCDGIMDIETYAILQALLQKYPRK